MEKKRRAKYQIAVYGIVGALGIILVLISLVFSMTLDRSLTTA